MPLSPASRAEVDRPGVAGTPETPGGRPSPRPFSESEDGSESEFSAEHAGARLHAQAEARRVRLEAARQAARTEKALEESKACTFSPQVSSEAEGCRLLHR